MEQAIRLSLLGPFRAVGTDGSDLPLSGKKVRALVAYLAMERDRSHGREELASLLWGDTGESRSRHNLRQALAKIRRAAGPLVVSDGDALRLDTDRCWVDAGELERLGDEPDPRALSQGLALYRGELLEGLSLREPAFEDWLRDARSRVRELACQASDRLSRRLVEQGRPEEALEILRRQLKIDPAREECHQRLMDILARLGRRAEALRQYRACAEMLERELGARPSIETEALHERIRHEDVRPEAPSAPAAAEAPERGRSGEPPSVAVLPFENLSGEEHRYFADGVAEDVIGALSRFGSLLVIARESSFVYRDHAHSVQDVGRALGAQFIVRGSLRLSGSRMRLGVQLLQTSNGQHLWAERYDRELVDVFAVQDEVTETIVATLAGRVEAARLARVRRLPEERLDAYDYVLRGKEYHHRMTPQDCERAIDMFERAIERDPDYALAHAWLGCGLGQAMNYHPERTEALLDGAEASAERGRELDDHEAECYRILAQVSLRRGELARARSHQERALLLNPNDDRSVCAMGSILTLAGSPEEGELWVRKAMRINPYHSEAMWFHLGRALFHAHRDAEALAALRKVTRPRVREWAYRVAACGRLDTERAREEVQGLLALRPAFDADAFVASLNLRRESDRVSLCEALQRAGL